MRVRALGVHLRVPYFDKWLLKGIYIYMGLGFRALRILRLTECLRVQWGCVLGGLGLRVEPEALAFL